MKIAIFADVQNAFYAAKHSFNGKLNYGKMLTELVGDRELLRATAYMTKRSDIDQSKFFGALENMGYEVKSREAKLKGKEGKSAYVKASYEVALTIDAVIMAKKADVIVLITGDSAYLPLINYLRSCGCRVELIGFQESTSIDMIKAADEYRIITKEWIIVQQKRDEEEDEEEDDDIVSSDLIGVEDDEQPKVAGQPTAYGIFG